MTNILKGYETFQLPDGKHAIPTEGGWAIHIEIKNGDVVSYSLNNLNAEGISQWFAIEPRDYGAPKIIEEPDTLVPVPETWDLLNSSGAPASNDQGIVGFIAYNEQGEIVYRLSLTNAKTKNIDFTLDGTIFSVVIDGEQRNFRVTQLLNANKNRLVGLVAVCCANAPEAAVTLTELEEALPVKTS